MVVPLKENAAFRRLYYKGKSAGNRYLVIYCARNRLEATRVGLTVSTKLGHAVVRNRVRRRLREICRLNSPAMKKGFDIVVVARSRCVGARYAKMNAAFLEACGTLGLLREDRP